MATLSHSVPRAATFAVEREAGVANAGECERDLIRENTRSGGTIVEHGQKLIRDEHGFDVTNATHSVLEEADPAEEVFEARVGAERVGHRLDVQENQIFSALVVGFLEPLHGAIAVAQSRI